MCIRDSWELDDGSTSSTSPWLCPCGDTTEPNAAHSWPSAMGTAAGGPQCRSEAASALRGQPSPVHTVLLPRGGGVRPSWSSPPWITHGALTVSYTHLRAHETVLDLVCRL